MPIKRDADMPIVAHTHPVFVVEAGDNCSIEEADACVLDNIDIAIQDHAIAVGVAAGAEGWCGGNGLVVHLQNSSRL